MKITKIQKERNFEKIIYHNDFCIIYEVFHQTRHLQTPAEALNRFDDL